MAAVEMGKDMELKSILDSWNLSHLYKHFLEHKISIRVLKILQPKHIERLFEHQRIGDQAVFEYELDIWKQAILLGHSYSNTNAKKQTEPIKSLERSESPFAQTTTQTLKSSTEQENEQEFIHLPLPLPSIKTNEANCKLSNTHSDSLRNLKQMSTAFNLNLPPTISYPTKTSSNLPSSSGTSSSTAGSAAMNTPPPPASAASPKQYKHLTPINIVAVRYNIRQILDETSGGQVILSYYEKHKILREEHRTALINVIARYIDANGCGLSLSESNQLESQIVDLFPTEKEEFYRTNKRGRIYNKIANMKRIYKKFNKEPVDSLTATTAPSSPCSIASPVSVIKEEETDQYDDYIINEWRNNIHTTEEFTEFWKKSQQLRLKHIDEIDSLQQILEQWPEYKQYVGIQYFEMDFKAKYPEATVFSEVFEANQKKLEKLLFTKVSTCSMGYKYLQQYQKCAKESQHLIILWVLHQLFPPNHKTIVDEMGNKRKKRHTIQDSQNAAICIRGSQSSLDSATKYYTNTATPPMILIVGELAGDIDQIFVYFEGVRYPMDSVVLAAQLCCQLFFIFNLDYPEETVLYYNFLQTFFLNIEPEVKNTKIYTVINEINAC